jgi:hypothetical protein
MTLLYCLTVLEVVQLCLVLRVYTLDIVAYLPHARKFQPQNQPFLRKTRTNNGTAGLRNPFPGYGPVNTLPRKRMTSHSNSTAWESRDWSRRDIPDATIEPVVSAWSVRRLYNATMVIFAIVQFQLRRVPDEKM